MPALQLVKASDDPITELGEELLLLTDREFGRYMDQLDELSRSVAEEALERVTMAGWRATPATMASELEGHHLWRYITLLGESARDAAYGIDPHQIWMLPSQYGKTTQLMWFVIWLLD